ncbi:MAG: pentapeptide repeat-containing protein, partial [Parvularculaceae bacterium]|nr:pentapeptide repeat-containing protein [Parvularculaceae bacterium]
MWKFVALIGVFMVAIFTIVTNVAAEKTGGKGIDPIGFVTGGLVKSLNRADDAVAPDMNSLIARLETAAPAVLRRINQRPEPFEARVLRGADLSGQDLPAANFVAAAAQEAVFSNALLDGATFEGAFAEKA